MIPFRVVDIQKTNLQHSVLSRKGKTPVHGSYDYIMPNELKSTQFNSISFVNCIGEKGFNLFPPDHSLSGKYLRIIAITIHGEGSYNFFIPNP